VIEMMAMRISFAYFYGESQHDAFLFAHTDDKWVTGEETTDYLRFFGFTSGLLHPNGRKRYPVYLNRKRYVSMPPIGTPDIFNAYIAEFQLLQQELGEKGQTLSRMVIARTLSNMCTMSQHFISNEVFWEIVNNLAVEGKQIVEAFCVSGIDANRKYYIGLCLPSDVDGVCSVWPWDSSCQTGSGTGVRRTLHTLNRRPFFKDFDPEHLNSLSRMLDGVYPHIVI
jgi:hypothetical protein